MKYTKDELLIAAAEFILDRKKDFANHIEDFYTSIGISDRDEASRTAHSLISDFDEFLDSLI